MRKILILTPWEGDWLPPHKIKGNPENSFYIKFLLEEDFEIFIIYLGEKDWVSFDKNLHLYRIPKPEYIKFFKNLPPVFRNFVYFKLINKLFVDFLKKNFDKFKNVDLIESYTSLTSLAGGWFSLKVKKPWVISLYGFLTFRFNPLKYWDIRQVRKLKPYTFFVANDGSFSRWILNKRKYVLYSACVSFKNEKIKKYKGKIVFGFANSFDKLKGFHYLLKIMKNFLKYSEYRERSIFLIAGKGEKRFEKELDKLIKKFPLNINKLGFLKWEEMEEFYSQVDVYLCPFIYANSTLNIYEVIGYGIPVIAFDVSKNTILKDGFNSLLVEPFNLKKYVRFMEFFFENEELLSKLSEGALKTSLNLPKNWGEVLDAKISFIKNIAGKKIF